MTDAQLRHLAERAGIALRWRDAFGQDHEVQPDTLRAVLSALDLPAGSDAAIQASLERLDAMERGESLPPLVTAIAGQPIAVPSPPGRYRLRLEDGVLHEGMAEPAKPGWSLLPPIDVIGYHALEIGKGTTTLAIAPPRCFGLHEIAPGSRPWGLAVQLYGLRRAGDGGIGDFSALRDFVRSAGSHGAAAVAISPVHAQFSADVNRFSPYAPSSRSLLNVVHATLPAVTPPDGELLALESLPLADWPSATRARLRVFRQIFERSGSADPAFAQFRRDQGDLVESHARFEALHAHFFGTDSGQWHWRNWPTEYRVPSNPAVAAFASDHANEVAFHAWLQYLADQGLGDAQAAAREAGMAIGLISDLAVGTDSGGSHAWSRQEETLIGLTVGAPPDLLSPHGQDWGLVAFSPRGLQGSGFSAFLEMIRTALRHAGGVRIDHVMGLARLWVLPEGAGATNGAYLHFPQDDLMRLIALESWRHRAIVLGEDLGTVPDGFQARLESAGIMGLRVLWFERSGGWFTRPSTWTRNAVAMTSTHDLPTVAGWWSGIDLDRRAAIGGMRNEEQERNERATDRVALWNAFIDNGAAAGDPPAPTDVDAVADAAALHVARSACDLVLLPIEDALGLREQPNLPGTLDEHPNWRRRHPALADRILDERATAARLASLDAARKTV